MHTDETWINVVRHLITPPPVEKTIEQHADEMRTWRLWTFGASVFARFFGVTYSAILLLFIGVPAYLWVLWGMFEVVIAFGFISNLLQWSHQGAWINAIERERERDLAAQQMRDGAKKEVENHPPEATT